MGIFKLKSRGEVNIYKGEINKSNLLLTRSNEILPLMLDVVARSMGNFIISKIDTISIYSEGVLLASAIIDTYTHPDVNQVQFSVLFSGDSFSGDFDELGLFASNMGRIATLAAISGTKDENPLAVTWTITLEFCEEI